LSVLSIIWGFLTTYWVSEFFVVLVAGGLLLAVELAIQRRNRARVEVSPVEIRERLGFRIKVKGGTLARPEIRFSILPGGTTVEQQKCDPYYENGNIYNKDYVHAGDSIYVFPFVAKHSWTRQGKTWTLKVEVTDIFFGTTWATRGYEGIEEKPVSSSLRDDKAHPPWWATLRIYGEGWGKEEVWVFELDLTASFAHFIGEEPMDKSMVWYELQGRRVRKGHGWL
jgi:hypothetical protein